MPSFSTLVHIPAVLVAGALVISALPATAANKTVEVPGFTGVAIESSLIANITVGGKQAITVEGAGQANIDKLRLEVIGGRLRAYMQRDVWDYVSFNDPRITVSITVPSLTDIEADAASDVKVSGLTGDELHIQAGSGSRLTIDRVDAKTLHLSAGSGAEIAATGTCVDAHVELSSGGRIGAQQLECVDLAVEASSAGYAILFASGQVNATASSGAHVELVGNPDHVDDDENSGGDVDVLN